MVNLVDLPIELLHTVFSNIHGENVTLNNICLAGNHTLLAIARPLTFREINIALSLPLPESHSFYSNFHSVYSDEIRRDSVRSISFCCSGFPDIKMSGILVKQLPRFVGVTHASIECEYDHYNDNGNCLFNIIVPIVFKMPALESFSISACSLNTNVFPLDYSRPFLKHVKFEHIYSGPILECAHVDGVQIIEARGTPLEHTIMQALYGISSLSESQQHLLTHLDLRLTCSETEPSFLEHWNAGEVADWFAMLPKGSLPNLEVLLILFPLRGPYINYFFDKISAGKLKTLWFGTRWDDLWKHGHAALSCPAEFRSLEEIFLPCSGDDFTVIFDLARAPRLAHVYFQIEIDIDATGQIAKRYRALIKTADGFVG